VVLSKEAVLNKLSIVSLIALAIFACGKKVPDDKTLFEEGQRCEGSQEYSKAFESYATLIDQYPRSPLRYKALFMAGYLQFEYLKDTKKATAYFDRLLKEYPDCDLADDAKVIRSAVSSGKDLMSVFEDSVRAK
jgi:outer membrane protein assembly factor BamD (BamD/ComL family)